MDSNRLRMNNAKTEFIMFGSSAQLRKCSINSLNVNGECVVRSKTIKYLGVFLDEQLTLKQQINAKCRAAMINLQRIKLIRHLLTDSACRTIVQGLVISHIDYANAMLTGLPDVDIKKLQRIQDISAKLICQKGKYDSPTECRFKLHWLPVHRRIDFKVLTLVYKCLFLDAPEYLKSLLRLQTSSSRDVRSNNKYKLLHVPFTRRKTFADRAFSVYAPKLWNSLPESICMEATLEQFKKSLKTYLFTLSYADLIA